MRHRVGQRKLGRVTEHRIAMLRNQAEALIQHEHIETTLPEGQGAPALRRADHHDRQARASPRGTPTRARCTRAAGPARHPEPRRRRQAVRHDRAALRGAAGRLHAHPARSATAAGTAPRSRRSSWSAASSIRTPRPRRPRPRRQPKPKGVGGRLRAGGGPPARQGQGRRRRGRRRRGRAEEESQARAHLRRQGRQDRHPR